MFSVYVEEGEILRCSSFWHTAF